MRGSGRIYWRQLKKFLKMPFGIYPEMERSELPLHPQDKALIVEVAKRIDSGESCALWTPYITPLTIALLARALVVGTVNMSRVVLYSPDMEIRRLYKRLYGVGGLLLHRQFPIMTSIPHAKTFSELGSFCDWRGDSVLIDGRRWRRRAYVERALEETRDYSGAKVFLLRDNWTIAGNLLKENGIPCIHIPPRKVILPDGWPILNEYLHRVNNYSSRIFLSPATVSEEARPLRNLELSTRRLLRASVDIGNCGAVPHFVETANRFVQNACLPVSLYKTAANDCGKAWADRYHDAVKASLAYGCPSRLRGFVFEFLNEFRDVQDFLKSSHPPKVTWLKDHLLRLGEDGSAAILCPTDIEARAVELWGMSEAARGCARLTPVTRTEVESVGFQSQIMVPGPVGPWASWMLASGIANEVRVLAYPWQAASWNKLKTWLSKIARRGVPNMEYAYDPEGDFDQPEAIGIDFSPPNPLDDQEDPLLHELTGPKRKTRRVLLKTTAGEYMYREDALVPTVELDRLADREVLLLRQGDTILVRTDGNIIDARKRVDEISQMNPSLSARAERAAVWRDLLTARVKKEQCSLPELHRILFPSGEISLAAFRDWVFNPERIGPNNPNIILLLTRLGLDVQSAETVREDLRDYRRQRRKVYRYIWERSRRAQSLSKGSKQKETVEENLAADPELEITLEALEELTTFAKVLEDPILEDEDDARE